MKTKFLVKTGIMLTLCMGLAFVLNSLYAQNTTFGIKGGINSSSIDIDNGTDYDSRTGFHIGGLAHIHMSSKFALQPELVYSSQGAKWGSSELTLSYLNIPVLGQFMVSNGFRLQTGPQLGFLVDAEEEFDDLEVDVDDAFESVDFSWVLGASYIFNSGIGIDLRYNIGISDITEGSSEAKNRVLQAGLFYQFNNNSKKRK